MTFFINAWLERENPILELRESSTNRMVYHVEGESLNEWLNSGDLSVNDLNNFEDTHSVIRDLLLKSIAEENIVEQKINLHMNNIIYFPRRYRRPSRVNTKIQKPDNVVYLFSVLSQRFLKQLNDAIY